MAGFHQSSVLLYAPGSEPEAQNRGQEAAGSGTQIQKRVFLGESQQLEELFLNLLGSLAVGSPGNPLVQVGHTVTKPAGD